MQEAGVQSLGWEDPLEKEMATHSSILAWEIPWTEEPGGLQSMGSQRVGHNLVAQEQQQQRQMFTFAREKAPFVRVSPHVTGEKRMTTSPQPLTKEKAMS